MEEGKTCDICGGSFPKCKCSEVREFEAADGNWYSDEEWKEEWPEKEKEWDEEMRSEGYDPDTGEERPYDESEDEDEDGWEMELNAMKKHLDILDIEIAELSGEKSEVWDKIKKQYKKLIKFYHPDQYESKGQERKEIAESKTKKINLAFERLKDIFTELP
tara:strand:+ start:1167 stop:1649 length:483 start_codon:yes stop_codon:yes gene_type:complete